MKLHILSDLHLEFSEFDFEIGVVDSDVVVLAGDMSGDDIVPGALDMVRDQRRTTL